MAEPTGSKVDWEVVIGLEVHVQLGTRTKAFSASAIRFGEPPNSLTDPIVLGLPGALPVFNRAALLSALRLGLALGCDIRRVSRFARKHYFYPDLPKGYQISQYDEPLCEQGGVEMLLDGAYHRVALTRIHLEEDAGKSTHTGATSTVDLNRAGIPLCEVVSEPDLRSAEEAAEYMRALRQMVRCLDISDGDMEKGQLRCDANVSLRPRGTETLGTRTELKNINSFKYVQKAIEHEIIRQTHILDEGGTIVQETRLWDAEAGRSQSMRSKEEAEDYRYFPDPDLPPLVVSDELIEGTRQALPELPMDRLRRLTSELGLPMKDARELTAEPELARYFDDAIAAANPDKASPDTAKAIANWILSELLGSLDDGLANTRVAPAHIAELIALISNDTLSGKMAKKVFATMCDSGDAPAVIVEREGLMQVTDTKAIEELARQVVEANPGQATAYRAGKTKLMGFFVGQVMKASQGKANPQLVNQVLEKLLAE